MKKKTGCGCLELDMDWGLVRESRRALGEAFVFDLNEGGRRGKMRKEGLSCYQ